MEESHVERLGLLKDIPEALWKDIPGALSTDVEESGSTCRRRVTSKLGSEELVGEVW